MRLVQRTNACYDKAMAFTQFNKRVAGKLLSSPDTFAFTLMTLLLDLYDDAVFTTDPAVLFKNMEEDLDGKLIEDNENKINAAITVMTTDLALRDPGVFTAVAKAFSGEDIDDVIDDGKADVAAHACLWAAIEMGLLNGDTLDDVTDSMSNAVIAVMNDSLDNYGVDTEEEVSEEREEAEARVEDAVTEPYYRKACTLNLFALTKQLLRLEVSRHIIADMLQLYNHSMEELEEDNE